MTKTEYRGFGHVSPVFVERVNYQYRQRGKPGDECAGKPLTKSRSPATILLSDRKLAVDDHDDEAGSAKAVACWRRMPASRRPTA